MDSAPNPALTTCLGTIGPLLTAPIPLDVRSCLGRRSIRQSPSPGPCGLSAMQQAVSCSQTGLRALHMHMP